MMTMLTKMDVLVSEDRRRHYLTSDRACVITWGWEGEAGCLKVVYTAQRPLQIQTETRI